MDDVDKRAIKYLDSVSENLVLDKNFKTECWKLYKKCKKNKVVLGRSVEQIIDGSIRIVSKKNNIGLSLDEIVKEGESSSKRKVFQTEKHITRMLGMKYVYNNNSFKTYLTKICEYVGISYDSLNINKISIGAGKDPNGLCGALLYLFSPERIYQEELSEIVGVSAVTLRKSAKYLCRINGWDYKKIKRENLDKPKAIINNDVMKN